MKLTIYRWIPCWMLIGLLAMTAGALAHPPSEITLNYDAQKKNLHIEMRHVTKNPRKHFIRKLSVSKNGTEIDSRSYVQQTTAAMLIADVPLEAVPGDVLRAEAVCNTAGRNETTLVIP